MAAMLTRRKLRSARLDKTTEHYDDINISGDELTLSMRDYNNPTEGSSNQRRSLSAAQMQKVDGEASKTPVKQTPGSMVKQIQRHLETQNPASCETTGAIQQKAITPVLAQLKRGFSGADHFL
jgi:RNA-splicing ligase RtcB